MTYNQINEELEGVITRAKAGETGEADDRILKATNNMIRAVAVRISLASARGERPVINSWPNEKEPESPHQAA